MSTRPSFLSLLAFLYFTTHPVSRLYRWLLSSLGHRARDFICDTLQVSRYLSLDYFAFFFKLKLLYLDFQILNIYRLFELKWSFSNEVSSLLFYPCRSIKGHRTRPIASKNVFCFSKGVELKELCPIGFPNVLIGVFLFSGRPDFSILFSHFRRESPFPERSYRRRKLQAHRASEKGLETAGGVKTTPGSRGWSLKDKVALFSLSAS